MEEKGKKSFWKQGQMPAPQQLFQTGLRVDKYTRTSSPALRQLEFPATKPVASLLPRRERPPSPVSGTTASPTSPGWKERDHVSSLILKSLYDIFFPQPDHSSLIPTIQVLTQNPSWLTTELLKETNLVGGLREDERGETGGGEKGRHIITAHTWPSIPIFSAALTEAQFKPPHIGSFSDLWICEPCKATYDKIINEDLK